MIGIVLAAGGGTRLRPLTDDRPKTMLEVDGSRCILELAIANLAAVGVRRVVVVTGFAAEVIEAAAEDLERRHGVELELRHNPRFEELNNAYSLWLARDLFTEDCLLVNGDTVHPAAVEARLLEADPADADVSLAVDAVKALAEEEMKLLADDDGGVTHISKLLDPDEAAGEYIGVARIHPGAGERLADALRATYERDPTRYYEDGFQEHIDRGGLVRALAIGHQSWVEVDDHRDLERARSLPHPL